MVWSNHCVPYPINVNFKCNVSLIECVKINYVENELTSWIHVFTIDRKGAPQETS